MVAKLIRLRRRLGTGAVGQAAGLIADADAARDKRDYGAAARLYEKALRLEPGNAPIAIQAGHMFKEAGDLSSAERHYRDAARLTPDDPDLALQLGHFFKVAGQLTEAAAHYKRALALMPDWPEPAIELGSLYSHGWKGPVVAPTSDHSQIPPGAAAAALYTAGSPLADLTSTVSRLATEVIPRKPDELLHANGDSVHIRSLGQIERSHWGHMRTLHGVEAARGTCLSSVPLTEVELALNGQVYARSPLKGYVILNEKVNPDIRKYVFNVWFDYSVFRIGRYDLEFRFRDVHGGLRTWIEHVVIAPPLKVEDFPDSDGLVPAADPASPLSLEAQINTRPSNIRPAMRSFFKEPPRNVLVARTDQLGDMVVSIPALKRLREILPDAHIVGVLTGANADLARTLGLFDEIIVIEFPDDPLQRRRVMSVENQQALRDRLAPYKFDIAMDLAPAGESRPILLLAGAAFTYGFNDRDWPWLSAGFEFNTHDRVDRMDNMTHSAKVMAFIEALGAMMTTHAKIIRRPELTRERLRTYGIGQDERFVILHTGARVVFSRWHHYPELARMLLDADPALKIVMLSEDPATRGTLPASLLEDGRFQLLDRRLPFDDFDALLSFCAAFIGNDSGPKHLAALRGANVVSLHTPRINWTEWGQELVGKIISRRVPCAGCRVYHDPEECGKDFACITEVKAQEVFDAVREYLPAVNA